MAWRWWLVLEDAYPDEVEILLREHEAKLQERGWLDEYEAETAIAMNYGTGYQDGYWKGYSQGYRDRTEDSRAH